MPRPSRDCRVDFCDRKAYSSDQLCRAHDDQQRKGGPLRPIETRVRNHQCGFEGCSEPHKAHGWCAAHLRQVERGQTPHRVVKRGPQPRKPRVKAPASSSVLPKDWERPATVRKPRTVVDKTFYGVPVCPPTDPHTLAAVLLGLRDLGAEDLAEVVGVAPEQIRAEAERWEMWEGTAA